MAWAVGLVLIVAIVAVTLPDFPKKAAAETAIDLLTDQVVRQSQKIIEQEAELRVLRSALRKAKSPHDLSLAAVESGQE